MKYISILVFCFLAIALSAQDIAGIWVTKDDNTGELKSRVEISEQNGIYYGHIREVFREDAPELCNTCKGDKKGKPLVGLEVIWGMEKDGDSYSGGKIMDPENGKTYKCKIELEDDNKLAVRGFIGFSLLGRTQYWSRAE